MLKILQLHGYNEVLWNVGKDSLPCHGSKNHLVAVFSIFFLIAGSQLVNKRHRILLYYQLQVALTGLII